MRIEFDASKSDRNERERGLPFDRASEFDFDSAKLWLDTRMAYAEQRWLGLGYLGVRLHVICFCRVPDGIRVISFRKANSREGAQHGFPLTRD